MQALQHAEGFTLDTGDQAIPVRSFRHESGEAAIGWTWTDGSEWSASLPRWQAEYTIRRGDSTLARGYGGVWGDPVRWRVEDLGTRRTFLQTSKVRRRPRWHRLVRIREEDTGLALAAAIQPCGYRIPVTIRPPGLPLAPALIGMLMITCYGHPSAGD